VGRGNGELLSPLVFHFLTERLIPAAKWAQLRKGLRPHIAIQRKKDGKVVEWMEQVSDDQYKKVGIGFALP